MPDDDLLPNLARPAARLARLVEQSLVDIGITLPQYRLLAHLSRGSSWPSPVARQLGTSLPSVTALVDGVVAKGLVQRATDVDDRRRVYLSMTEQGHTALVAADAAANARLAALASHLDEGEAATARAGLDLWLVALDREAVAREEHERDAGRATTGMP